MIVESVRAGVKRVLAVKFKERLRLQTKTVVGVRTKRILKKIYEVLDKGNVKW